MTSLAADHQYAIAGSSPPLISNDLWPLYHAAIDTLKLDQQEYPSAATADKPDINPEI